MNAAVVDASVAVKWVVDEPGTAEALALRGHVRLFAPELWVAECANILWKKVHRGELTRKEAAIAGRLLQAADVEFLSSHHLLFQVAQIAMELDHPAYDCLYLALAMEQGCHFVTADAHFLRLLSHQKSPYGHWVLGLSQAVSEYE